MVTGKTTRATAGERASRAACQAIEERNSKAGCGRTIPLMMQDRRKFHSGDPTIERCQPEGEPPTLTQPSPLSRDTSKQFEERVCDAVRQIVAGVHTKDIIAKHGRIVHAQAVADLGRKKTERRAW